MQKYAPSPKKKIVYSRKKKDKSKRGNTRKKGTHVQDDVDLRVLGHSNGANPQKNYSAYKRFSKIYHLDNHRHFSDEDGRSTRTGPTLEELEETQHQYRLVYP